MCGCCSSQNKMCVDLGNVVNYFMERGSSKAGWAIIG